jgi:hypothetical protein
VRLGFVLVVAGLALSGCGQKGPATVPVSGVVTLDNQPVEGAAVIFMPKGGGQAAIGATDKEGKFSLHIGGQTEQIPVGEYQVGVTKKSISGVTSADGLSGAVTDPEGVKETWHVPQKYSDPKKSELIAHVKPGMDPVEFKLSSN